MRLGVIGRVLAFGSIIVALVGCGGAGSATPTPTQSATPTPRVAPTATEAPTPLPSQGGYWPFVRTSCQNATAKPWLLVALGTSETYGSGVVEGQGFSPQAAYPALYANILCRQLHVPVELRSYYPSPNANTLAPLAWWIDKVENDAAIRADLGAADVVVLWALSSHDVVGPMLAGACSDETPAKVARCFEERVNDLQKQTDGLFGRIADLVPDRTKVLAADAYAPPFIASQAWWSGPYRDDVRKIIDPYFAVSVSAPAHGFSFVDTERVFNGPRLVAPADGLFQPDGIHPTAAGQQLIAETFAEADGLGD